MSLLKTARLLPQIGRHVARVASATQIQSHRNAATMPLTFASPGNDLYKEAQVEQVDVPGYSSAIGIFPSHVPVLAVLKPGKVVVKEDGGSIKEFFVSSGSVTINDDSSVQILAEEAVPLDQLDASAIRDALQRTTAELATAGDDVTKAELQIQVDCYTAMLAAAQ